MVLTGAELLDKLEAMEAEDRRKRLAKKSAAAAIVELAGDFELFCDADKPFAAVPVDGHVEVHALHSRRLTSILKHRFAAEYDTVPSATAMTDAIGMLEARALLSGDVRTTYLRVADLGSRVVVDLGDDKWRALEIDASGWRIVDRPLVPLRRSHGLQALPEPIDGGRIDELRQFVNVESDDDFTLTVAWLVAALSGRGPFPVLVLHGEQGSGKSTTSRVLRRLVDPNVSDVRSEPRDIRDLAVTANGSHVVAIDNASHLEPWLSDAICRLSTGAGFSTRQLYTDDEEVVFEARRPVILNGIEEVATRPDLIDRSLIVRCPHLTARRDEREFWAAFEAAQPRLLGALASAVSAAIARWDSVRIPDPPRLADFARLIVAAEESLGWEPGQFMQAYGRQREQANQLAIEASPVGCALLRLELPWSGTAADLLRELTKIASEDGRPPTGWPKSPRGMRGAIERLMPPLREEGIIVSFRPSHKHGRILDITRDDAESF